MKPMSPYGYEEEDTMGGMGGMGPSMGGMSPIVRGMGGMPHGMGGMGGIGGQGCDHPLHDLTMAMMMAAASGGGYSDDEYSDDEDYKSPGFMGHGGGFGGPGGGMGGMGDMGSGYRRRFYRFGERCVEQDGA
jgi:hypothetical protein